MRVRMRGKSDLSMVMYDKNGENWFIFYWMEDPNMINVFNWNLLAVTKKEVLDILEEFQMMSSREMVEFDKTEDSEKKIGNYLCNSRNYLRFL